MHEQLTTAVDELANSDAWRRMLEVAARMPTYSPSNVLLIAVQRPEATRVAGFGTWKSLGRHVCKGEKGIAILAPCLYRGRDNGEADRAVSREEQANAHEEAKRELRGFRVVHVFDVNQTEGDPLPDVAPDLLIGAAPDRLWEQLVRLVEADGFVVERGACVWANGYTRFDDCVVRVRDDVDLAQAVKTLAHELGHIRADHGTRFADTYHRSVDCRGVAEIEAESIAYLVTAAAGLDAGGYSVPYVAGWSGGDPDLLRATATKVLATASKIDEELASTARPGIPDGSTGVRRHPIPFRQVPGRSPVGRAAGG
ncbi:MAG: ssDNA-binding domain-containing protein [Actinomycetia bacterium]|nr:ssDNA-binding domain-containing protein [Actinomycetes bacterium]